MNQLSKKKNVLDEFNKLKKEKVLRLFMPDFRPSSLKTQIIGSINDGTFIAGSSDLDVLLIFEYCERLTPEQFYDKVHYLLETKYSFNLRISHPGFIVHDFNDAIIEFTPCIADKDGYKVVNKKGDWFTIYPQLHYDHFKELNDLIGQRLTRILRKVKKWKYRNKIQISSFYLQVQLVQLFETGKLDSSANLNTDLLIFYSSLLQSKLECLEDPIERLEQVCPSMEPDTTFFDQYKQDIINQINYYHERKDASN